MRNRNLLQNIDNWEKIDSFFLKNYHPVKMTNTVAATCDIFEIVAKNLNKSTKEDVSGLFNLLQTSKEMNTVVKSNTDYEFLKKIVKYSLLSETVILIAKEAVDEKKVDTEKADYIIPYLTDKDIRAINEHMCHVVEDFCEDCIYREVRYRCSNEVKILYNFIKRANKNYNVSFILNDTDDNTYHSKNTFPYWLDRILSYKDTPYYHKW